jgi:hypothetical protein
VNTDLILLVWGIALLGAVTILVTDLKQIAGAARAGVRPATIVFAVDALLMIGVGLATVYGRDLAEYAPRSYLVLQGALPLLLCLCGGWLAARWFVAGRRTQVERALHSPSGWFVLALLLGIGLLTQGVTGLLLDSAAVLALALVWLFAQRLEARGLQRLRLGAALALFWAGAFLVYLMLLPPEVVVEAMVEEGAAHETAGAERVLLWVVPPALLTALLLGFFKRQRG